MGYFNISKCIDYGHMDYFFMIKITRTGAILSNYVQLSLDAIKFIAWYSEILLTKMWNPRDYIYEFSNHVIINEG